MARFAVLRQREEVLRRHVSGAHQVLGDVVPADVKESLSHRGGAHLLRDRVPRCVIAREQRRHVDDRDALGAGGEGHARILLGRDGRFWSIIVILIQNGRPGSVERSAASPDCPGAAACASRPGTGRTGARTVTAFCEEFRVSRIILRQALEKLKQVDCRTASSVSARAAWRRRYASSRAPGRPVARGAAAARARGEPGPVAAPAPVAAFFRMPQPEAICHFVRVHGWTARPSRGGFLPAGALRAPLSGRSLRNRCMSCSGIVSAFARAAACMRSALPGGHWRLRRPSGIALADPVLRIQSSVYLPRQPDSLDRELLP